MIELLFGTTLLASFLGGVVALLAPCCVSVTTDPADLVQQKVADERLSTPVLADPTLQVSRTFTTNQYGMMGTSRNGHTFILVGADGVIRWRADYGGQSDYTMFVPTAKMLADLATERAR